MTPSLDLHGVRHVDVPRKVDIFLSQYMQRNFSEVEIITGISNKMKKIVNETLSEYGLTSRESFNPGSLYVDL